MAQAKILARAHQYYMRSADAHKAKKKKQPWGVCDFFLSSHSLLSCFYSVWLCLVLLAWLTCAERATYTASEFGVCVISIFSMFHSPSLLLSLSFHFYHSVVVIPACSGHMYGNGAISLSCVCHFSGAFGFVLFFFLLLLLRGY